MQLGLSERIADAGLPEPLLTEQTGVAFSARPAVGPRVIAAPGQREIDAEVDGAPDDLRLGQRDQRRVDRESAGTFGAGLGSEVRQMLEGVDVLRTAVRVSGAVQRV